MPRYPHPTLDWGTLEIGYTDEFGEVAPDVYDAAGTTIIQVTHSEANAAYGDRVIELADGWVVKEDRAAV